jgi:hypothetical protein
MIDPEDLPSIAAELERISRTINNLGKQLMATFHPMLYSAGATLHQFHSWLDEHVEKRYREAGSPYGNSVEGALRWLREQEEHTGTHSE